MAEDKDVRAGRIRDCIRVDEIAFTIKQSMKRKMVQDAMRYKDEMPAS